MPALISVLVTIHNAEPFLREAIDSLLAQTDPHFEVVAIDDGSSDGSGAILDSYSDLRLRVFHRPHAGRVASLIDAAQVARGEFLSIQDADDLSLPGRLAAQRAFLESHPEVGLLGTAAEEFDDHGRWTLPVPTGPDRTRRAMMLYNPFFTSSLMFRRSAYEAINGFDPDTGVSYDADFLLRMTLAFPVDILPRVWIRYRHHPQQMTAGSAWRRRQHLAAAKLQCGAARKLGAPAVYRCYTQLALLKALFYQLPSTLRPRTVKDRLKYAILCRFGIL